jgi:branched-subunit amino acid transport protein
VSDATLGWTIVGMAAVTFGTRLWGLVLPTTRLRGAGRRFLDHLPVAVFAAMAAAGLPGAGLADTAWRAGAALLTGVVAWRTRSMGAALLAGLMLYLVVRFVGAD